MSSQDYVLSGIDSYLRRLTNSVGENEVEYFKRTTVPDISDPNVYLNKYISGLRSLNESWASWKVKFTSEKEKICEYDEKLKKCDAYLNLMKKILSEKEDASKKANPQTLLEKTIEECKTKKGDLDRDVLFKRIESDLIARGDCDTLLSKVVKEIVADIKVTQSLVSIQKFLNTVKKMESPEWRTMAMLGGFVEFYENFELQWVALIIAKNETQPTQDSYLIQLVDRCKKTKNKVVGLDAANAINDPKLKAKYLGQMNSGRFD